MPIMTSITPPLAGRNEPRDPVPNSEASTLDPVAVEAVVAAASRAPSLHNTQPWQWSLHGDALDLRADRTRQLHIADPDGHSLLISCGAAAELTRLALAKQGWTLEASLLPDVSDPDLLARFQLTSSRGPGDATAERDVLAAGRRRSDRRVFTPDPVSSAVVERLRTAAQAPAVYAHFPVRAEESLDLAVAISRADRYERDEPAYAAEMAEWVRRDPSALDGVPTSAIPAVQEDEPRHTDIPLRDFELGIPGTQLIHTGADERPLIAVIFTEADSPLERLRAGQSMMRLMIQAELDGLASCPLSQSVDLVFFRSQLRNLMSWTGYPQMMLRLGHRPDTPPPPPLTRRRPVRDVLTILPGRPEARPAPTTSPDRTGR
jgi:nitroreductase